MKNNFSTVQEALDKGAGKVKIRGWVYRERKSNKFAFIVLRDGTNIIQCVVRKKEVSEELWGDVEKISIESSVIIEGELAKDDRAPTGFEVKVSNLDIINLAERFPITKDQSTELLLDLRHLWIRSRDLTSVWRVKAQVLKDFRHFFDNEKFVEVTPPIITGSACEGGSTLFTLKYFDEKAYLSQSAQLYLEAMIFSLSRVWSLTPSFRAEPSKTTRHLTEYWHLEAEAAWYGINKMIELTERLISHTCGHIAKTCLRELAVLGRDPKDLLKITPPFPRITYDEALELLKKDGMKVSWGKDLRTLEEEQLMKHYDKPLIVTNYPKDIKAFYMKHSKDGRTVDCFDIIAPEGYGEIVGGSERETSLEFLKKRLKEQGEKIEDYSWYLDLRKYGSVPHSGFGLGVERFIAWICRLETIRDAIPFPRTIKRSRP